MKCIRVGARLGLCCNPRTQEVKQKDRKVHLQIPSSLHSNILSQNIKCVQDTQTVKALQSVIPVGWVDMCLCFLSQSLVCSDAA